MITKIPEKIEPSETKVNKFWLKPLVKVSFKIYKSNIKKKVKHQNTTVNKIKKTKDNVFTCVFWFFFFFSRSAWFFSREALGFFSFLEGKEKSVHDKVCYNYKD